MMRFTNFPIIVAASLTAQVAASLTAQSAAADCTFMLQFASGKSAATPTHAAILDRIATDYPRSPVRITGHADAVGGPGINGPLSLARAVAVAVRDYILSIGGRQARIVSLQGRAAEAPLVVGQGAEAANRRVEVVVPGCDPEVVAQAAQTGAFGGPGAGVAIGPGALLLAALGDGSNGTTTSTGAGR